MLSVDPTWRQTFADNVWLHFFQMGHSSSTSARPTILVRGEGSRVWDQDGNRYIDALAGLFCVNAGYGRREIADAIERLIEFEGPETIAAIIMEPIQNSGGAIVPPPGYLQRVRQICDRYGILLIADEVICGFGRVGAWFGSSALGVVPDIITCAKGITSGYAPLGAVMARPEIADAFL